MSPISSCGNFESLPPTIRRYNHSEDKVQAIKSCLNTYSSRTERCVGVILNKEGILRVARQERLTTIGEEMH